MMPNQFYNFDLKKEIEKMAKEAVEKYAKERMRRSRGLTKSEAAEILDTLTGMMDDQNEAIRMGRDALREQDEAQTEE